MKLRDIEKNLKKEQEVGNVPDVYARVKKAPLNKLLTGETPIRAFQKQLVMRLLITVLLLFLVAGICLGALWVSSSSTPSVPECRVTVTVMRESGNTVYGVVVRNEYDIAYVVKEIDNGVRLENGEILGYTKFADFMTPAEGDVIRISASCTDSRRAASVVRKVISDVNDVYGNIPHEIV